MFYDFASGKGNSYYEYSPHGLVVSSFNDFRETFNSYGIQLMADFHMLRIPFAISGGFQSAWKNLNEAPVIEFLFNIDLFGMTLGNREL